MPALRSFRCVLVTGAAGFIGSHFIEHWLAAHPECRVVGLDLLTYAGNMENLSGARASSRFTFVQADICARTVVERLMREYEVDCIVNFAAETHVDRSVRHAGAFVRANVQGVHSLLEAARRVWLCGAHQAHRFHQVSTDEVFGALPPRAPIRNESAPYSPGSPYAASKASGDHLVRAWQNTYGLRASISFSSNVYGPRQHPEKFIPVIIRSLRAGECVPLYGDGLQSRCWLHVHDFCRALVLLLGHDSEGTSLYLGSTAEMTNLALVRKLCGMAGVHPEAVIRHVPDRPGHDRRYGLSTSAFELLTAFQPNVGMDEGLAQTIAWYSGEVPDPGAGTAPSS